MPARIGGGTQKTSIAHRVWKIHVDSVLQLDRAAKRESTDDSPEGAPRRGRFLAGSAKV